MYLQQPGFTYYRICSACGTLTKNKKRLQKFRKTGDTKCIYRNEPDEACFQHYMAYGDFKDLIRRTSPDKVLRDKAFSIAKSLKYQRGLVSMVYKFFNKKSALHVDKSALDNGIKSMSNQQFADEFQKNNYYKIVEKEKFIFHINTIFWMMI